MNDNVHVGSRPRGRESGGAYGPLVARVVAGSPVRVSVESGEAPQIPLDEKVEQAFERALAEALRNVERHAGGASATLRIEPLPGGVAFSVLDDGPGLSERSKEGVGTRNSIRGSVDSVGGRAIIANRPEGGLSVRLEYRRAPRPGTSIWEDSYARTIEVAGGGRQLARRIAIPTTCGQAYLALRHSWGEPNAVGLLTLALTLTFLVVSVVRTIERGAPSKTGVTVIVIAASLTTSLGLWWAAPGSLTDLRSWVIGFAGLPITILAFYLPAAWIGPMVVPQLVTTLAFTWVEPELSLVQHIGLVNAVLAPPLVAAVLGHLLRRSGEAVRTESSRLVQAESRLAAQQSAAVARWRELSHVRTSVLPWLHRITDSVSDVDSPATRRDARVLEAEVRDALYLPGVIDAPLQQRITAFRISGGTLEIHAPQDPSQDYRLCMRVLDLVLDHVETTSRVSLTLGENGRASVLVLAPMPPGAPEWLESCLAAVPHEFRSGRDDLRASFANTPPQGDGPARRTGLGMRRET